MKKILSNKLVIISYVCILVSIISMFTTIVGYTNSNGVYRSFSLADFWKSNEFDTFVSYEYTGKVYLNIDISIIRVFAVIGIIAVICAIVGLAVLSKQKDNIWSFVLTLIGLIGTMAPALLIFICVILLGKDFKGTISSGIYPIVSVISMVISIIAATQVYRKNKEYNKKLKEADGLIFRGGDLS